MSTRAVREEEDMKVRLKMKIKVKRRRTSQRPVSAGLKTGC
jgi:hypothetical protein